MVDRGEYDAWKLASPTDDEEERLDDNEAFVAGMEYRKSGKGEYGPDNQPTLSENIQEQEYLAKRWVAGWCDADMSEMSERKDAAAEAANHDPQLTEEKKGEQKKK